MTTQHTSGSKAAATKIVTTNTGRILRVSADAEPGLGVTPPVTPPPAALVDPARRADVLFRVRRDEGHEISAWWMIGAFLATSGLVILLLSGVPGIA
ncbi:MULTISPECIES: hypothetical protein [Microbacterium]|uniref:hypothetical protein n=1 Tax=Microbacterium TaxID=33882 RepID=UPI000648AACD|nr:MULTISPECIES: hypothetical protein [Microbacterium]PKQ36433.1 MAG: hypothetical protein CVT61_00860 [Actinobacteria bacterium HGW-Actinobacteria-11]MCE0508410.1 hypothetical protein [Microbacterium sp. KKR3/1]MCK8476908.1 hypothetical protein [Microbacterium aurugineum]MCZ4300400.1 hypothetical protein [Microbacterium oxydans]QEA28982.1 hypothetical protein FGL91_10685 [Microbacterium sp. CBA3102]